MRVGNSGKDGSVGNESCITYRPVKALLGSNLTLTAPLPITLDKTHQCYGIHCE